MATDSQNDSPSKRTVSFVNHHDDDLHDIHTTRHIPLDSHSGAFHRLSKARIRKLSAVVATVEPPTDIKFPSCRLVLMGMAFFGFLNIYCLRVDLSVALVAMVKSTDESPTNLTSDVMTNATGSPATDDCGGAGKSQHHASASEGTFEWTENMQGVVLASFFYGYVTTQLPGGILAERFGGKRLLLFGIFWTAVLTILTPPLTRLGGFAAIVAVRILEGIGEGVTYPSMHAMLSKWAPPLERSKMVTSVYAGAQIGTVIAMPLSGMLCQYVNWDSVFYLFGGLGIVWSIMWIFLVYDDPEDHPRIDPKERAYIETSQGVIGTLHGHGHAPNVPWLSIVKSLPVWATAVAHFSSNWGYYTLLTCLPTYFKKILHFDMKSNGLLAGLPYLVMWIVMVASGLLADKIRSKHLLTTTNVRKLFNAVGFLCPAACLIGTGYIDCNAALAVSLIVIAVGLSGLSMAGWGVNHLDLAPPYAGTLMGITNGIATIPGFVSPSVVGALTNGNQTREAWRNVFFISAAIYAFGTIFYCIFGSGQRQPWSLQPSSDVEAKNKEADSAAVADQTNNDTKE